MKTSRGCACALVLVVAATGCTSVSVQRIDPDTRTVLPGTPDGIRFNRPRAYLSVFEPFVIDSDVYIASGQMSPDGNHVLLTEVPAGLNQLANQGLVTGAQRGMGSLTIAASAVKAAPSLPPAPREGPQGGTVPGPDTGTDPQADTDDTATGESGAKPTPDIKSETPAAADAPASAPKVRAGLTNYKAVNDNNAYATIIQPRYFNILWLPDDEEEYVVSVKPGLGNSGVLIGLGQGWSFQSLDATSDNSGWLGPLQEGFAKTIDALQKVATAKIQAPLAALTGQEGPQSGATRDATTFGGGTPVTVKVTKARVVAPGLYKILTAKEVREARPLSPAQQKRIHAPVYPFTNIAFNTYDVLVIEAARSTGDSPLRMHQYQVLSPQPSAPGGADPGGHDPLAVGGAEAPHAATAHALNAELSNPARASRAKEYYRADIKEEAGVVTVNVTKHKGSQAGQQERLASEADVRVFIVEFLKHRGVAVQPANVAFS